MSGETCTLAMGGTRAASHPPAPTMDPMPAAPRYFSNLSDADKVVSAQTALSALAEQPEIAEAMAPRGYTKGGRLLVGHALLAAVAAAVTARTERAGDRIMKTAEQDTALDAAKALYAYLAGSARAAYLRDRPSLVALGLTGEHGGSQAEQIARMRAFAVEARKDERDATLAEAEVTDDALDALDVTLSAATLDLSEQDTAAARAEHATAVKDAAYAGLVEWMVAMHAHARVTLKGQRPLQQMLGMPRR